MRFYEIVIYGMYEIPILCYAMVFVVKDMLKRTVVHALKIALIFGFVGLSFKTGRYIYIKATKYVSTHVLMDL